MSLPQTCGYVLMIAPAHFAVNPQTAASNRFQQTRVSNPAPAGQAAREVRLLADKLGAAGIQALVFPDTNKPVKPDAVFVNNWVSFHADGRIVLYPLQALNRRTERRMDIINSLRSHGFQFTEIVDLAPLEQQGLALEGTGSLALDRQRAIAFAALSARTHQAALAQFTQRMNFRVIPFRTLHRGVPIYHTNVMLALGRHFAVICDGVIPNDRERAEVLAALAASDRELIQINPEQMESFAANLVELDAPDGPVIALSARALAAFDLKQRRRLEAHGQLLTLPLPAIETGGGSLRCMVAEVFLPRADRGPG